MIYSIKKKGAYMITFRISTEVKDDRRVVLTLPPEVPIGQADLVVDRRFNAPALGDKNQLPLGSAKDIASAGLPDWCNVYEGLADEQIADLEKTILQRADLARPS